MSSDAFGRSRVANPSSLYDVQFQYDLQPFFWESKITAGGSESHLSDESSVSMNVSTSGDKIIRQTRRYHRYQPGKSQEIYLTFQFGNPEAGIIKRLGYFDDNNGIFLQQDEDGLSIILRSSSTGSVVDQEIRREDWNIDSFDGSHKRFVLDESKVQIFYIQLQWLGVGSIECGFNVDEESIPAHEFRNANEINSTYMTTANLPLRYEIESTAGDGSMKQICSNVISGGGIQKEGIIHSAANVAGSNVTTPVSVIVIRPKLTFKGITNRIPVAPLGFSLKADVEDIFYELIWLPTAGGALTWVDPSPESSVEYALDAVTMSGGLVLDSGFAEAGGPGNSNKFNASESISLDLLSKFSLGLSIDGTSSDILALVVRSLGASSDVKASLTWREFV